MQMILQASALTFVLIGALQPTSCLKSGKTETKLHVPAEIVYVAFRETLELNCSVENVSKEFVYSDHILWKHNNTWIQNFTHGVNNNTVQLRRRTVSFEDAGVYECAIILNSSRYHVEVQPKIVKVVVGVKPPKPTQPGIKVFGMPPQNVTITWTARHANLTNEVRIGVWNKHCVYKFSLCKQRPSRAYEELSCSVGQSGLEELFPMKHSTHAKKTNASRHFRDDVFCAMVKVSNAFGSNSNEGQCNLIHETRCPAPRDFSVVIGDHALNASWFRPRLVLSTYPLDYHLEYTTKSLHEMSPEKRVVTDYEGNAVEEDVPIKLHINSTLVPNAKYEFRLSCSFYPDELGPEARTEVTTKEAAPSEAPLLESCKVKSGSPELCDGNVSIAWKLPPNNTWNGFPKKFMAHYRQEKRSTNSSFNESLQEFNGSATKGILKDVNACKNVTIRLSMCTKGGCGPFSLPCHSGAKNDDTKKDDDINVRRSHEGNEKNNLKLWISVALGISAGLVLAFVSIGSIRRKRLQKTRQRRLSDLVGPLNIFPQYENEFDDRPSVCEASQDYDELIICDSRPLLKEIACSIGKIPVTRI